MKVLANRYLYKFRELLPESVEMDLFDPVILPENTSDYDALFLNTTTKINSETLPDPGNLSFIATGSSGSDHLDLDYLKSRNIKTAKAAGCNAKAVAEYILTTLLCFHKSSRIPLDDFKAGLIGVGHVGTEVSRLLDKFSISHITYDPPRADRDVDFETAHFDELKECNILSFHTPITYSGEYPTYHLLNKSWYRGAAYHMLINTSRGKVIDEDLVLEELETGGLNNAVIDVWKDEPGFNRELALKSYFATPHIAGYSVQSKIRASEMIINQFCDHADIPRPRTLSQELKFIDLKEDCNSLEKILLTLHPIRAYDESLRNLADFSPEERSKKFALLRSETPLRYEFSSLQIKQDFLDRFPELGLLGIQPK
ncbi:4-phosphoerythronate dehydrogenase PdxB [soil metagenome]